MKALTRILAVAAMLFAAALIFSPLLVALFGSGLRWEALAEAFRGIAGPLGKSAGLAAVGAFTALLLGVPFAILVERSRPSVRRILWTFGLLVFMVPPYIVAEAWIVLLGPAGKLSRPSATFIGLGPCSNEPIEIARFAIPGFVYTWPSAGVVMGACFFPIVALAIGSAYRRTDQRIFESARLARGTRGVWEIAARGLFLPALGAALLVFAATLTEFAVPQLLRVRTVGEAIYERISGRRRRYGHSAESAFASAGRSCRSVGRVLFHAGARRQHGRPGRGSAQIHWPGRGPSGPSCRRSYDVCVDNARPDISNGCSHLAGRHRLAPP